MKRWSIPSLAALGLVLSAGIANAQPISLDFTQSTTAATIIPPDRLVAGKTQLYWAEKYLNWLVNTRFAVNPNFENPGPDDPTGGKYISVNNDGPVVFLPITNDHTVTIPPNRPLLVPVSFAAFYGIPGGDSCNGTVSLACGLSQISPEVDGSTNLSLTVDGTRLEGATVRAFRQTSHSLSDVWLNPYPDNILPDVGYKTKNDYGYYAHTQVIDGFYIIVDHLSVGKHRISVTATRGSGEQDYATDTVCVGIRTNVFTACREK